MSSSRPSVRAAAVKAQWSPSRVLRLKRTTVTVLKTVTGVYGVRACHHTALVCAVSRVTYGSVQNDLNRPRAPRTSRVVHISTAPARRARARRDARARCALPGRGQVASARTARARDYTRATRDRLKSSSIIIHRYQTIRTTDHRPRTGYDSVKTSRRRTSEPGLASVE